MHSLLSVEIYSRMCSAALSPVHHPPPNPLTKFTVWGGMLGCVQGITKRCRLSWLTKSSLVYEPKCGLWGGDFGVSTNEYSCTHGAQTYFGDLTPYLTYGCVGDHILEDFYTLDVTGFRTSNIGFSHLRKKNS
jgi:hypothetical protein